MKAAITALHSGDPVGALLRLLAIWREVPAVGLGVEIERLGAKLAASLPPVDRESNRHAAWLERFAQRHPADLPLLVQAAFEPTPGKRTLQRLDSLLELPRDPRFHRPLLAWAASWISALQGSSGGASQWTRVLRLFVRQADPRTTVELERLLRVVQAQGTQDGSPYALQDLEHKLTRALALLPSAAPDLPGLPALTEAVDAVVRGPALPLELARPVLHSTTDEVRNQIYADVEQDGPIEVWADLLTEAGDPLGTFVSLQLADARKPLRVADQRVVDRLRKSLGSRLVGPLAPLVDLKTAGFRRGLLDVARVLPKPATLDDALLDHPFWRSVRYLHTTNAHLRREALQGLVGTGIRLVPGTRGAYGTPPGFEARRATPPGWAQLCWLLTRPHGLELKQVCAALPTQIPIPKQVDPLEDPTHLGQVTTLHLVESLAWGALRGLGTLERRLGRIPALPWVRSMPHLILDGLRSAHGETALLALWIALNRGPGRALTVFDDAGLSWTAQLTEDDGIHLDLTLGSVYYRHHPAQLVGLVPDPSAFASITVRCPPVPGVERERMAGFLAGCGTLKLPAERRA